MSNIIRYPRTPPPESALYQAAIVLQPTDSGWQDGSCPIYCEGAPCHDVKVFEAGCCFDVDYGEEGKSQETCIEFVELCTCNIVYSEKCSTLAHNTWHDVREAVEYNLLVKERKAMEECFWGNAELFPDNECALNTAPEILCPELVMDPCAALSALECELYCCTDQPYIHVPRPMANYLCDYIVKGEDGLFRTCLGSIIVFGTGYNGTGPGGEEAEDGCTYMYGTGPVKIAQGEVCFTTENDEDAINLPQNFVEAQAERVWGFAVDPCCGVYGVQVAYCKP